MVIIILLIVAILGVAAYDFFIAKTWNDVQYSLDTENEAILARHRRARAIRKAYVRVLAITVVGMIAFCISAIVATDSFGVGTTSEVVPPPDTIQMTLAAPPLEPVKTLPEKYKVEGNAGIDQHAQEEREEIKKNDAKNPADARTEAENDQKSTQSTQPVNKKFKLDDPHVSASDREMIENAENQRLEMLERSKQRAAQREQARLDQLKKQQDGNKPKTNPNQTNTSGTASVDWDHNWRKAYKGDDSYLRTPEYRCPNGVSGKVRVKVKVNSNGNVIGAEAVGNVAGTNQCLVDNAIEYAYKSRFELSSKASDEGVIVYTYHP